LQWLTGFTPAKCEITIKKLEIDSPRRLPDGQNFATPSFSFSVSYQDLGAYSRRDALVAREVLM